MSVPKEILESVNEDFHYVNYGEWIEETVLTNIITKVEVKLLIELENVKIEGVTLDIECIEGRDFLIFKTINNLVK